ncbi:phenylalanine--tRNA ligase subunit alpha [Pseudomonadota bacterium]|nr:phenylalanine--tRNA ligase subunit alpha [Pseudomonadota bacterium]|tara:strand:+ start:83 stop:826 length:744 start_codon:yes stop_codon:yes gene_type:complete
MSEDTDIFYPEVENEIGSIHPINQIKNLIIAFLNKKGFSSAEGPEVESEIYNFDLLNIKKNHPARQMHDTFYLKDLENVTDKNVLRTHTSPVQIRGMLDSAPPIAIVSGGKVYRKDDDSTHLPMFHQIEGIVVDEDISFPHLRNLIFDIVYFIFGEGTQVRFRPSYFPFTEPSAEVDIYFEDKKEWLEILGCGIVNPVVLENCKIDSKKFSGLAFGLGVERIAMLKYGISDIREFYKSNLDFLKQFK